MADMTKIDNRSEQAEKMDVAHPYKSRFDFFDFIVDFRTDVEKMNVFTEDSYRAFVYNGDRKADLTCYVKCDRKDLGKSEYKELMLDQTHFAFKYRDAVDTSNSRTRVFPPFAFEPLRHRFFELHAGSVSLDEKGIVLIGVSGRGKTTLTVALVRNGYKLLSEDITPIDMRDVTLECFPQAAGIRKDTAEIFPEMKNHIKESSYFTDLDGKEVSLVDLRDVYGDCLGRRSLPSYIFFIERKPGGSVALREVRKGQAVVSLLSNAVAYYPQDLHQIIDALTRLARHAECYSLEYGEAQEAVDYISSIVKKEKT